MEKFQLSQEQRYANAKKKVKEIRSFYYNLMCYCIVIPTLIFINLMYMPHFHWFWFSAVGWGCGVTIHGLAAFGKTPFVGNKWEERKIREIIEKEQQKKNNQYQ